jgi:putative transposase
VCGLLVVHQAKAKGYCHVVGMLPEMQRQLWVRFPPDVISYAVWLPYRFPLSLRMVEELLAARGIELTYETVRRWSVKFGLGIARRIRSTALERGDKWHLDEAVVTINGKKH